MIDVEVCFNNEVINSATADTPENARYAARKLWDETRDLFPSGRPAKNAMSVRFWVDEKLAFAVGDRP